ncbi:MAG: hypothetical protein ACKOCX_14195 [Planctomycetota bacterium]
MRPGRVIVLLPCHTLDDFPTWLDEPEADGLLTAWTAAWHPCVIAASGAPPRWASIDLPPPGDAAAGVVPAFCDERFTAQADPEAAATWVRHATDAEGIAASLAGRLGLAAADAGGLAGAGYVDDFHAIGLAALLAELLARRMRMEADLTATGFDAAVVAAARAAVDGDDAAVEAGLSEAYGCLDSTRSRYYPVESWAIDIVLIAPTTPGDAVLRELESPVPLALVATGQTVGRLAERAPDAAAALREAVAAGRVEPCGGRDEERPLDLCTPEAIREAFDRGREAWRRHVGRSPACHAAIGGGASAILPQVLAGYGCTAAIWSLFDGTPLPDPGCGRIRWEGSGGGAVEAIARQPLDAGRATSVLELPDRIGDALDHDHVAVIQFARYAGRMSRWHGLLRRIGVHSGLVGTFVTPSGLMERTAGGGTPASFEPDAFAVTQPPAAAGAAAAEDPLDGAVQAIAADAVAIASAAGTARPVLAAAAGIPLQPSSRAVPARRVGRWLPAGLFGRRRDDDALVLDNGLLELRPHPRTGGLLSLRRPTDRGNRISQQVAVRTTAAAVAGHWASSEDRADYTRMEAESIIRHGAAAGGRIESRGRLVAADGRLVGRFRQTTALLPDLPLAMLDVELELEEPLHGRLFESHAACRFAWHENEDVELRRSLHLQSIVTERTLFTAPHFVEIVPRGGRSGGGDSLVILTGGLPWHLLSSPHVLDSVVLAGGRTARRRLAVGIGLERPWDAAVALAAGGSPTVGPRLPPNVRLTVEPAGFAVPGTVRVGLVESAGQAGEVRIDWAGDVARAAVVDLAGHPRPDVHVTVQGRSTTLFLGRYQWLHLVVEFAHAGNATTALGAAP